MGKNKYDCAKCPGYCCSYPNIHVQPKDVTRLAEHFKLTEKEARKRFTKKGTKEEGADKRPRVLRHQKDEHFTTICSFFDTEKRHCTIYHARPGICREYPGRKHCGYYDFLKFERLLQEDDEFVPTAYNP